MNIFQTIILGIIEGLTEFLPVSSTGHMIIASSFMGIDKEAFTKLFEIVIQLGAILAVVVIYWRKFFDFTRWKFFLKLFIAVLPACLIGLLFESRIKILLASPLTVGISTLIGGIFLLFVDGWFQKPITDRDEDLGNFAALKIGFWQVLAMIPGTSRSAASIVGGMQQKLTRRFAAEFSFFLAVPTMVAATGYELFKSLKSNPTLLKDHHNVELLLLGSLIAFIVAMMAIKSFIGYLQKHGFKLFGVYRIFMGVFIILLVYMGYLR